MKCTNYQKWSASYFNRLHFPNMAAIIFSVPHTLLEPCHLPTKRWSLGALCLNMSRPSDCLNLKQNMVNTMLCDPLRLGHKKQCNFLQFSVMKYSAWDTEQPCEKPKAAMLWGSPSSSLWRDPAEKPWDHLKGPAPSCVWFQLRLELTHHTVWETLSQKHLAELSSSSWLTETMRNNKCFGFKALFRMTFSEAVDKLDKCLAKHNSQVWLIQAHLSQAPDGSLALESVGAFLAGIQAQLLPSPPGNVPPGRTPKPKLWLSLFKPKASQITLALAPNLADPHHSHQGPCFLPLLQWLLGILKTLSHWLSLERLHILFPSYHSPSFSSSLKMPVTPVSSSVITLQLIMKVIINPTSSPISILKSWF